MRKFNQFNRSRYIWFGILAVVLLVVLGSQIERLVNQGTFFGYQVRANSTNISSSVSDLELSADKKSTICRELSANYMKDVIGNDVTQTALFPDQKDIPAFTSCQYKIKDSGDSVTIALKKLDTSQVAKTAFDKQIKDYKEIEMKNTDQAYFKEKSNQYQILKSDKILVISVSSELANEVSREEVSQIAEKSFSANF